jgi:metal-responsive CopG/Arc/MetJ family transcriptional regulator
MRRVAVFIPEELLSGLKVLKAEHGTPEAESIRRAIAAYLAEKGVTVQGKSKTPQKKPKRKS